MSHPPLGAPVRFTRTLHRRTEERSSPQRWWKVWRPSLHTFAPRDGIVVGVRTLSNGPVHWGSYDVPTTYTPAETFTAYLVAVHLRQRPVLVLPEDVTPL